MPSHRPWPVYFASNENGHFERPYNLYILNHIYTINTGHSGSSLPQKIEHVTTWGAHHRKCHRPCVVFWVAHWRCLKATAHGLGIIIVTGVFWGLPSVVVSYSRLWAVTVQQALCHGPSCCWDAGLLGGRLNTEFHWTFSCIRAGYVIFQDCVILSGVILL